MWSLVNCIPKAQVLVKKKKSIDFAIKMLFVFFTLLVSCIWKKCQMSLFPENPIPDQIQCCCSYIYFSLPEYSETQ